MVAPNSLTRKNRRREDLHCRKSDTELRLQKLQAIAQTRARQELAEVAGTDDPDLIDRLLRAGFTAENFSAISVAPIAAVAWGSGYVSVEERVTALNAVYDSELSGNRAAIRKFHSWLDARPSDELLRLWADYVQSQSTDSLSQSDEPYHDRILRLAKEVAQASGGFLGFCAVCPGEQSVLDHIHYVLLI